MDSTNTNTEQRNADLLAQTLNGMAVKIKGESSNSGKFIYNKGTAVSYESVKNDIDALHDELTMLGFKVNIYENIDAIDVSKEKKFFIKISDRDDSYFTIDLGDYRDVVLDYTTSEVDYIVDYLNKLRGYNAEENKNLALKITEYLSYLFYFKDLQIKYYEGIGWSSYDGKRIFKYNTIYSSSDNLRSECHANFADDLASGDFKEVMYDDGKLQLTIETNWAEHTMNLMNQSVLASTILASACTGLIRPLLPFTKENNININIHGEPGSGKSTICHYALSIFGRPSVLEGSFIDKPEAIELLRAKRPVIPYMLDDRLLAFEGRNESRDILYNIFKEYEGKIKERAAGSGKELSGQRTYAPIISSSVGSMFEKIKEKDDVGQFRRFMEFNIKKTRNGKIQDKRTEVFTSSKNAEDYEFLSDTFYGVGVHIIVNYLFELLTFKNKYNKKHGYREESIDEIIEREYNTYCSKISKKLKEKETEELKGLTASTGRFALILTAYKILKDSLIDVVNGDNLIYTSENEIIDFLLDNLVEKMESVRGKQKEKKAEAEEKKKKEEAEAEEEKKKAEAKAKEMKKNIVNVMNFISQNSTYFAKDKKSFDKTKHLGVKMMVVKGKKVKILIPNCNNFYVVLLAMLNGRTLSLEDYNEYLELVSKNESKENIKDFLTNHGIEEEEQDKEEVDKYAKNLVEIDNSDNIKITNSIRGKLLTFKNPSLEEQELTKTEVDKQDKDLAEIDNSEKIASETRGKSLTSKNQSLEEEAK